MSRSSASIWPSPAIARWQRESPAMVRHISGCST
jgi:hypothetical protein